MGVQIPEDYALLSIGTQTPLDAETMYWTLGIGVGSASDPTGLASDAVAAWDGTISTITSSVVHLVHMVAKLGPSETGPTFEEVVNIAGTDGGALPPPNCAVLVSKVTTLGGRKGRGRAYLPGVSSFSGSLDTSGTMSSGDAVEIGEAVNNFGLALQETGENGPFIPVLLHSDATQPSTITSYSCAQKLATQRRRLRP